MISLEHIRELEPTLKDASDEEVAKIRDQLYGMAQLAYESWVDTNGSKIPVGIEIEDEDI